jgi:hypothetical protein
MASSSRTAAAACMETAWAQIRDRGFSAEVASYASKSTTDSTDGVYSSRWSIFAKWCSDESIVPYEASIPQVADFWSICFEYGRCCQGLWQDIVQLFLLP